MTETTAPAVKAPPGDDLAITELVEFSPDRLDGVKNGATGIPFLILKAAAGTSAAEAEPAEVPAWLPAAKALAAAAIADPSADPADLLKAVNAAGEVDEAPDIAGGKQAIQLIARLIINEAQELEAGCLDEVCDIEMLCQAVDCLRCWLSMERSAVMTDADADAMKGCGCCGSCTGLGDGCCASCGDMGKAEADAQDTEWAAKGLLSAKERNALPDSAFAYIEPGGKKDAEGKTTPRSKRHFPIHDKAHADNAMARIEQGAAFGDEARRKVKAAQRKFGSGDGDASKATAEAVVAEEATAVNTEAIDQAVAKALAPYEERVTALGDQLAKAQADLKSALDRPIHGGPVLSAAALGAARKADGEDHAAKAAYYDDQATRAADPSDAEGYRQLAAQQRAKLPAQ